MLNDIALRRLNAWILKAGAYDPIQAKVFALELGQLGYKINNLDRFTSIARSDFAAGLAVLQALRGADVNYVPLFSQFPDDLPNDHEYLICRILSFWGVHSFDPSRFGADPTTQMQHPDRWQAAVDAQAKKLEDAHVEWITLTLISETEAVDRLCQWVLNLLYGATPIKEALWQDILTVLHQLKPPIDIVQVKIKESLARLAADQWQQEKIIVKTPTDLLRMFAFLTAQDVSLAQKVDFKGLKFSKPQRRAIVRFLSGCPALAEDLLRYRGLWISLSKWLHPGDFHKQYPRVAQAFDDLRNNRIQSFESRLVNAPIAERLNILQQRPSLLLRRLTWLLKDLDSETAAAALLTLEEQLSSIPLPLLMTTYFAVNYGGDRADESVRVIINKQGKSFTVSGRKQAGDVAVLAALEQLILTKLQGTKDWQNVWIDPALDQLVIPLQARKQSDGLLNLARGSRLAIGEIECIRLFVYWHETAATTDLDLSLVKLDGAFNYAGHVAWNRYGDGADIAHSGDIQSAPLGAAEFIDIRLSSVNSRYLLPAILRYTGEPFPALQACYAGWMKRQTVGGAKTFDAKTVVEKVDVHQTGRLWIPFILDVETNEIIYVDLYSQGSRTIETNPHFPRLVQGLVSYPQAKPTFGALARWYVAANHAKLVDRSSADTTVGLDDTCTVNVLKLVGEGVTSF